MTTEVVLEHYFRIARDADDASRFLAEGIGNLGFQLGDCGSMAGSDLVAQQWATDYDAAATAVFEGAATTTSALVSFSARLVQAAYNWAEADGRASPLPGEDRLADAVPTTVSGTPPPAALGDSGAGLQGVIDLVGEIGVPIPNGDTGKLDAAAAAWRTFQADHARFAIDVIDSAAEIIAADPGPEIELIEAEFTDLQSAVIEINSAAGDLATACAEFKQTLDDLRQQIRDAVEDMLIEQAASVAVGIALSFVTAGIATAAAAGIAAGRITSTARKIKTLIEAVHQVAKVSKTGRRVGQAVRDLKGRLDEIAAKLPQKLTGRAADTTPPRVQVTFPKLNKLQSKYDDYAEAFGVDGNRNPANLERFRQAIEKFIDDPTNQRSIFPNYHGQGKALITYNPTDGHATRRRVVLVSLETQR